MSAVGPLLTGEFSYIPLSKASNIRLLIVEAGEKSDDIVCTLVETLIGSEDQVNYEAISYVWGDPRKANHIICDDFHLGITANLHAGVASL
jgi:Heterokaryon incompatibility protein (HET)